MPSYDADPYWSNVTLLMQFDAGQTAYYNSWRYLNQAGGFSSSLSSGSINLSSSITKFSAQSLYLPGNSYSYCPSEPTTTGGNIGDFGYGDFTVEFWVYMLTGGHGDAWSRVMETKVQSSAYGGWFICSNGGGSNSPLYFMPSDASASISTGVIPDGGWHHVAVTRESGTTRIFLDGVLKQSTTLATAAWNFTEPRFTIGKNISTGNRFKGYLDNLRVTKGVARYTADFEVPTAAFPTGKCTQNSPVADPYLAYVTLRASANADGGFNNTFVNEQGIGTWAVESGMPCIAYGRGKFGGGAYSFDGYSNAKFVDTSLSGVGLAGTGDFTVECWALLYNDGEGVATWPRLFATANYSESNPYRGFYISVVNSVPTKFRLERSDGGAFIETTNVANGVWYHVAVSRASGVTRIFLDGVLCGSMADTQDYNSPKCTIGAHISGTLNQGESLRGLLDEIRFTMGVARYTANFTPPDRGFTLYGGIPMTFEQALSWEMRDYLEASQSVSWEMRESFLKEQDIKWGLSNPFTVYRCLSWSVLMPINQQSRPMRLTKAQVSDVLNPVNQHAILKDDRTTCG